MAKPKFSKSPTIPSTAEAFIDQSIAPSTPTPSSDAAVFKKEKTKPLYLRAPVSLWNDVHEIMARTGLSMNAICLDILRPKVRQKLKELKDD